MLNIPEISKLGQDYGDKTTSHLSKAIENNDSYNGSFLYKNLQKNSESVAKLGERAFPALSCSRNGSSFSFGHSPRLSEAFNHSMHALGILGSVSTRDEEGRPNPCLRLNKNLSGGESTSTYLRSKAPTKGMEDLEVPRLSKDTIEYCDEPHCNNCKDCASHRDEVKKAVKGIISSDPNTGDGMRSLHFKNLITTLNSWAAHQESQGNDSSTYDNKEYDLDQDDHAKLATSMRDVANRLHDAYEQDYIKTNGMGGGIHRDYFGVDHGRTTDVY
jgi:hypothetical protein